MPHRSPQIPPQRWQFLIILVTGLALAGLAAGCSALDQLRATATPTATATNTPTPTATPTPTPTPTPTVIPPPQGEWSQYWDSNQIYELLIDRQGYLWGRGVGTIIRWNLQEGTYQEFGLADGLPGNTADGIFLGPSGEAWLYFRNYGLYQFDDPDWMAYFEQDEIEGFRLDATALGSDGSLWVCSEASLARFDGQEWFSLQVEGGLPEGFCEYLTVDRQGNPWMQGVDGPAVYREPDWITYTIEGVGFDYDDPRGAYTAPNGIIWFAYGGEGMLWYDGTNWDRAKIPPKDFAITSTGKVWLLRDGGFLNPDALNEYKYGVHLYIDFETNSDPILVEGWHWNLPFAHEMPVEKIERMDPGISNDLWMVYKEGLIHLAGGKMELIPIEGMTSSLQIKDLALTRTGQVYLARQDGIYKLAGTQIQPLLTESELAGANLTKLAVGPNGALWLVSNRGLQSFQGGTWSQPGLPGGNVTDLVQGPGGEIWVYHNPYISRWDGKAWESFNSQEIEGLPNRSVTDMFVDEEGTLWLAYYKEYFASFDGSQWATHALPEDIDFGYIRRIARDQTGTVYLVSSSNGKEHLNWQDGQDWESRELDGDVEAIKLHPGGELWLLLCEGELFTLEAGDMEPVGLDNPAPETWLYDLVFGLDGSLWLASSQGAFRYDNQGWESYTVADGLRGDWVSTIAVEPDGAVWFAGSGLTRLGPPLPE